MLPETVTLNETQSSLPDTVMEVSLQKYVQEFLILLTDSYLTLTGTDRLFERGDVVT